jgi:hypothetical protein
MTEYLVAPLDEPDWKIDAEEFASGLRSRWPAYTSSNRHR